MKNRMYLLWVALFVVLGTGCGKDDPHVTVTSHVQGTWVCEELWEGAVLEPNADAIAMRFIGNRIEYLENGSPVLTGTFTIQEDMNPTRIDIVYEAEGKVHRIPGILEVAPYRLELCHPNAEGGPRPDRFEATEETCFAVFKRMKKGDIAQ